MYQRRPPKPTTSTADLSERDNKENPVVKEEEFVPLLGSSNGLFLEITAVFFCFCMGPVLKEAQNTLLSTLFLSGKRIELAKYFLSHAVVKICPF